MKRKLKNLSILTMAIATLGFTSIAYANEGQEDLQLSNEIISTGGGGFRAFNPTFEMPNFENHIDQLYYFVFGEGFEYMQQLSRQVNRTVYEDGLRMEISSTVTVTQNIYDDLRGQGNKSYTFLTIQDETGNRLSAGMNLDINLFNLEDNDRHVSGHARFIDFNEDTQTAAFVVEHNIWSRDENTNLHEHIDILVEGILTDLVFIDKTLEDISLAELVNSHNPTFTHNEVNGPKAYNDEELSNLGIDIDINSIEEISTLVKDELKIPIEGWDSAYISNIALEGNLLHIQINAHRDYNRSSRGWHSIDQLINTNTGDTIRPVYSLWINNSDEYGNPIDDREYQELVFYIGDLNELSNYYIYLLGSYYDTKIDTNLEISFYSPVIQENIFIEEEVQIKTSDKELYISNIHISPIEMKFTIGPDYIFTNMDEASSFVEDELYITFIYENGTVEENVKERWGGHLWGMEWTNNQFEDGTEANLSNVSVILGGSVINIEELIAISINDVVIDIIK